MKSTLAVFLFAIVCVYIVSNRQQWKENMYTYDAGGYYQYLPALFIKHDVKHLYLSDYDKERNILNKYPVGTCLFELPFFLIAHGFCDNTESYPPDGYSTPYQIAGIAATIFWVVAGLFVLRRLLLRYFSDTICALVLLCIAFGTNLYSFTAFSHGASHSFSFFLFAAILYYTEVFYRTHKPHNLLILAALAGWVAITRPTNIIIVIIPVLWNVSNIDGLKARLKLLTGYAKHLVLALLIFAAIGFIQIAYWRYSSGQWLYYSYGKEGFAFLHPHIWEGLFSYRKGWFVYTPIALIGILGFYPMWKQNKKMVPALALYFIAAIYIVFSWRNWWYGGGFACRPLVESYALLSLPLGYLIQAVFAKSAKLAVALSVVLALFIALNLFQTYQYFLGIIHYDRMSRAYYWKVFGKTKINFPDYEQYLMEEKEYWRVNRELDQ